MKLTWVNVRGKKRGKCLRAGEGNSMLLIQETECPSTYIWREKEEGGTGAF